MYALVSNYVQENDFLLRYNLSSRADRTYKDTSIKDKDISKKVDLKLDFAFYVHGWQSEFNISDKGTRCS